MKAALRQPELFDFRYGIIIRDDNGHPEWFYDAVPFALIPSHVFDLMECRVVDEQLDLCKLCDVQGGRCHVIENDTGRKLCPVLFADAVNPPWKVEQIA
jgi:hypothetical protein